RLQHGRRHPSNRLDLVSVDFYRTQAAADEHRAQLVLRAVLVELRLILKFVQEAQRASEAELLLEPAHGGALHALFAARMTAAAVRPVHGPQALRRRALLDQELARAVEYEQREGAMQDAAAFVAAPLAQVSDPAVGLIDENQRLAVHDPCGGG